MPANTVPSPINLDRRDSPDKRKLQREDGTAPFRASQRSDIGYRIDALYRRLFKRFGPQHWWPAGSAWEMMVGAILTQNTSWTNVEKAMSNLRGGGAVAAASRAPFPSVKNVASMPRRRMEKLLRPSGYFRQKAKRLQEFAREMIKDPELYRALCGRATRGAPQHTLRNRLLSLHGIGPETADSILLYAGGYRAFVVDAYTRRIGQRMGLFETNDYHKVQALFQSNFPEDSALYNEFHALIVRFAKEICTKRDPACAVCPMQGDCAYARGRFA